MKKKTPKKISLEGLEQTAIKYLEKYIASEYQLKNILKRKIIKASFFYKINKVEEFKYISLIISKFKKIGLIDDKKFSENKALTYVRKGFSQNKIIFNLKKKGISKEDIEYGINNLKKSFYDHELASALVYAKKKIILFDKKKGSDENQKNLMKMSQAGFTYDIAKQIINLGNEKEFIKLEKYANDGDT